MTETPPDSPEALPEPLDLPLKTAIARLANGLSPAALATAQADWLMHLLVSPAKQAQLGAMAWRNALLWLRYAAQACNGQAASSEISAGDRRFSRPEWRRPPFNALAQGFLLSEAWWNEATTGVRGVSRHHEDVVSFVARQWLDMLSPSNFPASNPQVLGETLASGGANLANGHANWLRDATALAAGAPPRGVEAFRPGGAVAVTPGQVVYRNRLIELLQYAPSTPRVGKEPVLVVPSWIMKFYILDLTPQDSLVKYLVDQGHTVFMISWRNPGAADRDLGMDDYLESGVLDAVRAVQAICPGSGIHATGYCLGGTLLAIAAALLAARGEQPLRSLTLLAAQVDFEEPGQLGLFIDESQIAFLEDLMAEHGYLDGRQMAGAFQLINSKDLVWSKLVHEYLMGAQTPMTAMRAWNADATRLPARMHSEYLRRLYLHNALAEGDYRVRGESVDLHALQLPMFVVATEHDHVSPWRSVYRMLRLAHSDVDFVLASGGHNVGIVSPPSGPAAHPQASYRHAGGAAAEAPADPERWLAAAPSSPGSWWPHWHGWLQRHGSAQVRARPVRGLVEGGRPVAAPGTYVFGD